MVNIIVIRKLTILSKNQDSTVIGSGTDGSIKYSRPEYRRKNFESHEKISATTKFKKIINKYRVNLWRLSRYFLKTKLKKIEAMIIIMSSYTIPINIRFSAI